MNRYNSFYPGNMPQNGRPRQSAPQRRPGQAQAAMAYQEPRVTAPAPQPERIDITPRTAEPETTQPTEVLTGECNLCTMPLGMAYINWQKWGETYNLETGLSKGTIFPELDLPFLAYRGAK